MLKDVDLCVSFAKELHDLPMEERLKYDIDELGPHKLNGYRYLHLRLALIDFGIGISRSGGMRGSRKENGMVLRHTW